MPLASLTSVLSDLLTAHGTIAVFTLMALDALLPVGGELIMLLAGALAAGAIGSGGREGLTEYLLLASTGTIGYAAGSVVGWEIGRRGGTPLIARHGRWLHLSPDRFARAERWFARHGRWAVLVGRVTPLVRSFISIPAGVLGSPFGPYVVLTTLGSALWCFGFAGAGWALGSNLDVVHHAFRYADVAVVVAVLVTATVLILRRTRPRPSR